MRTKKDLALLHGGGQGSWVWEEVLAALDTQSNGTFRRVLALDVPGCGQKRDRATDGLTVDDIARELVADLETADMGDVVLVGHSQAGTILPLMAELRPGLFSRLVFLSCICPLPGQTLLQQMGTSVHGTNENEVGYPVDPATTDMRTRYAAMFCNDMDADQTQSFIAKLGADNWPAQSYSADSWRYDHLRDLHSTYIVCLKDAILPVSWQEVFALRAKAERLVRIDAGHQAMNTRPSAIAEILRHEAHDRYEL